VEQVSNLSINVLDGLLFPLICLEDLQKLFVDFGFVLKSVLSESGAGQKKLK
jgi:hypothetical protein